VLVVARPPLLRGVTDQLHSMNVPVESVDASSEEDLQEWMAASASGRRLESHPAAGASPRRRSVPFRREREQDDEQNGEEEPATHDVLIIDGQLLSLVNLATLPYKHIITLTPPGQGRFSESGGPNQLIRPVTRQALREALADKRAEHQQNRDSQEAEAKQKQQESEAEGEETPFLVLVVDDNKVNQKVVGAILRRLRVPYHTASDGIEAIEHVCRTKYDLVLMDLTMPRVRLPSFLPPVENADSYFLQMGGLEATRIIRTMEKSTGERTVDIVAMTAASSKDNEGECMQSGFTLYIPKPVKFGSIKELIETRMAKKRERQEAKVE
jgi:CheY-like chemotaxis protein